MFKTVFLLSLSLVAVLAQTPEPQTFAVLVAGSNYWYNYRHQADVCHAYQVLHNHGVPDSNIIVFMYDDIANNAENPTPGIIINHPNGSDVYHGVLKDYTGDDVTPENFMNVLLGNAAAVKGIGSGRVLKSGPNDHVFLNFVDHGATGILAFPNDVISVKQLEDTLTRMSNNKQYQKLVFYVEACEAGSMFKDSLQDNENIFVTTASDWNESSYACYYDPARETYLGDLYSVNWMEDSDAENLGAEQLQTQYTIVKNLTDLSHVQEYGDMTISNLVVGAFQGQQTSSRPSLPLPKVAKTTAPSYDVPLDILFRRLSAATDETKRAAIKKEINDMLTKRENFEKDFKSIVSKVAGNELVANVWFQNRPKALKRKQCHHDLVHSFSKTCYNFAKNPYTMKFAYVLANICESGIDARQAVKVFQSHCKVGTVVGGPIH